MKKQWCKISLFFLFLVALIGTLLRATAFIPIPLAYTNLVHAHSHVAFQGWVYTMMFLLLTHMFLTPNQIKSGRYPLQFKLTVLVVIGVLITFSLQGYALYSIIFSTLFQLLNYWFIHRFLKDSKHVKPISKNSTSLRFVKTGLWLGVLSTILPFGIGILSAKGMAGTDAYQSFVYSFLHLQYNGWFLFAALGLFFKYLENNNMSYHNKFATNFYWLITIAIIPATTLSLLGMEFFKVILIPAYLSAILLGIALLFFIRALPSKILGYLKKESAWFRLYILAFLISFVLKTTLQCLSVFPIFKPYAFKNRLIIIAYLHLSLIGVISFLFFALSIKMTFLSIGKLLKLGSSLLVLGFFITEFLLTSGGFGLYYNPIILIMGSAMMALGILLIILNKNI